MESQTSMCQCNKQTKNQTKQNIALILKGITDLPGVIWNA